MRQRRHRPQQEGELRPRLERLERRHRRREREQALRRRRVEAVLLGLAEAGVEGAHAAREPREEGVERLDLAAAESLLHTAQQGGLVVPDAAAAELGELRAEWPALPLAPVVVPDLLLVRRDEADRQAWEQNTGPNRRVRPASEGPPEPLRARPMAWWLLWSVESSAQAGITV